jgi:selenocysteine lyase/cysteine desulfurase
MLYFNHNATSFPKPESVQMSIAAHFAAFPAAENRSASLGSSPLLLCRQKTAQFFNTPTDSEVIFTGSSTESLNLAILGIESAQHIITTVTEHNAVLRPLRLMARDKGVRLSFVPCDKQGFVAVADISACIAADTTAIIVNHCSNVTGAIQNLAAISDLARQNRLILIVDASQSAGAVAIDLTKTPVDAFAFASHKNLWAVAGLGGLILSANFRPRPLKVGGTGSNSAALWQPTTLPDYYEAGTANTIGAVALTAGIDYVNSLSMATMQAQKQALLAALKNKLSPQKNIRFYADELSPNKIPVLNLSIENLPVADLAYILAESFGINARAGLHCAPLIQPYIGAKADEGTYRISFSHLNTMAEIDILADAICQIAQQV